ncbi:Aste57867_16162 [Aphanomyces stellatus]|uniref:Aste57867_16162 protein n=1 Tax=Aphanomyces stellatus TaxID=120398 RepID=A0A485L5R9_9STRA|nr:hypothetical protein As57867_016106 [Aphanomyces stellatus]VFT92941.1 Aste57867_16162 [Aphanomyces stellatus]
MDPPQPATQQAIEEQRAIRKKQNGGKANNTRPSLASEDKEQDQAPPIHDNEGPSTKPPKTQNKPRKMVKTPAEAPEARRESVSLEAVELIEPSGMRGPKQTKHGKNRAKQGKETRKQEKIDGAEVKQATPRRASGWHDAPTRDPPSVDTDDAVVDAEPPMEANSRPPGRNKAMKQASRKSTTAPGVTEHASPLVPSAPAPPSSTKNRKKGKANGTSKDATTSIDESAEATTDVNTATLPTTAQRKQPKKTKKQPDAVLVAASTTSEATETQSHDNQRPRPKRIATNIAYVAPAGARLNDKGGKRSAKDTRKSVFEAHLSPKDAAEGLRSGKLLSGDMRVNKHNRNDAYVSIPGLEFDIYIDGTIDQNRAVDGDTVVLSILPQSEWRTKDAKQSPSSSAMTSSLDFSTTLRALWNPLVHASPREATAAAVAPIELEAHVAALQAKLVQSKLQPTAKVVHILERKGDSYVGVLRAGRDALLFDAVDKRLPRGMRIQRELLPSDFKFDPKSASLCMCTLGTWSPAHRSPNANFVKFVGPAASVESDILGLLTTNNLLGHLEPFSPEIEASLPTQDWCISDDELARRRDLREWMIFSIDPPTARDLDDAMSIRHVRDDVFEVGVHIADVSHFLTEGSALDMVAQERCTSVYLVHTVLPMLPRVLCEQLCSLNASVDRLAFSVLWHMRTDGSMVAESPIWFGKTVIRSCCQMDYGTAQRILDGDRTSTPWPRAPTGGHSTDSIASCVEQLGTIARARRRQRFETGAIKLHRPKLSFQLDDNGDPVAMNEYPIRESNHLVEEFMLLANYLVAQRLIQHGTAVLRHHLPPETSKWENAWRQLEKFGLTMDPTTTTLTAWLATLEQERGSFVLQTTRHFLTKPMTTAEYIIAETLTDEHRHYALNLPYYTHFTSPIRRYADVLVHRLLEASLATDATSSPVVLLEKTILQCNFQKRNSKAAQQSCDNIYLARYIHRTGALRTTAAVVGVGTRSFTLMLLAFGFEQRINASDVGTKYAFDKLTETLRVTTNEGATIPLSLFQEIQVELTTTGSYPLELVYSLVPQ